MESKNLTEIPEHFFDDVPDNLGFSFEHSADEDENDTRKYSLNNDWVVGKDDCGGSEYEHDEIFFTGPKDNLIHLKLVPNND